MENSARSEGTSRIDDGWNRFLAQARSAFECITSSGVQPAAGTVPSSKPLRSATSSDYTGGDRRLVPHAWINTLAFKNWPPSRFRICASAVIKATISAFPSPHSRRRIARGSEYEDLLPKLHGTDLIAQKWQGANLNGNGRAIRLEVECPQSAEISECCVEFGALDRILYNLINNACRHTETDHIRLVLLPIPDSDGENLRFVLINTVSANDLSILRNQPLEALFEEGTSTTGSGYGLAIASDFVSHAYGLQSQSQAIQGGYLGATIIDDSFAAWFHWPRVLKD
jgi:hypothetical protein